MIRGTWRRVSRQRPCPVCGKPDWCLVAGPEGAPEAAICPRVESDRRCGDSGWLHVLRRGDRDRGPRVHHVPSGQDRPIERADLEKLHARWRLPADHPRLAVLASALGVTAASLARLEVGWAGSRQAWSFPMRAGCDGLLLGVRLRFPDGTKRAVPGGKEGLFIPSDLPAGERLFITEGPTDCAALLDLGFAAVGRPSCSGGVAQCAALCRRLKPAEAVIVADADEPGQRGAENLASVLVCYVPSARIVQPPAGVKDARDWVRAGARAEDVLAAVKAARLIRLGVRIRPYDRPYISFGRQQRAR